MTALPRVLVAVSTGGLAALGVQLKEKMVPMISDFCYSDFTILDNLILGQQDTCCTCTYPPTHTHTDTRQIEPRYIIFL